MAPDHLPEKELAGSIIGAFYDVYDALRFGFTEGVYAAALAYELRTRGHDVQLESLVAVHYKGVEIARQRLDMLVDERVVVELKATEILHPSARRQLLSYLKGTSLEVGLLLHFGPEARFYRIVSPNTETIRAASP